MTACPDDPDGVSGFPAIGLQTESASYQCDPFSGQLVSLSAPAGSVARKRQLPSRVKHPKPRQLAAFRQVGHRASDKACRPGQACQISDLAVGGYLAFWNGCHHLPYAFSVCWTLVSRLVRSF